MTKYNNVLVVFLFLVFCFFLTCWCRNMTSVSYITDNLSSSADSPGVKEFLCIGGGGAASLVSMRPVTQIGSGVMWQLSGSPPSHSPSPHFPPSPSSVSIPPGGISMSPAAQVHSCHRIRQRQQPSDLLPYQTERYTGDTSISSFVRAPVGWPSCNFIIKLDKENAAMLKLSTDLLSVSLHSHLFHLFDAKSLRRWMSLSLVLPYMITHSLSHTPAQVQTRGEQLFLSFFSYLMIHCALLKMYDYLSILEERCGLFPLYDCDSPSSVCVCVCLCACVCVCVCVTVRVCVRVSIGFWLLCSWLHPI